MRTGGKGRTPSVTRSEASGACTRTMAKMISDVASTLQPATLTMSVRDPGRPAYVTPAHTCSSIHKADVQASAPSRFIGRDSGPLVGWSGT